MGTIYVQQEFQFVHQGSEQIDTLYLYDWNHSYSSTNTPLARKISEEFNFQFEKSLSTDKGNTTIKQLKSSKHELQWVRLIDQPDIIAIIPTNPVQAGDRFTFSANYTLKLPSSKFTGYGVSNKNEIYFSNGFLTFAYRTDHSRWELDSNLGFNDMSKRHANVKLSLCYPDDYTLTIPIRGQKKEEKNCWKSDVQLTRDLSFYLQKENSFRRIPSEKMEIHTNLIHDFDDLENKVLSIARIHDYLTLYFGNVNDKPYILDMKFYGEMPIIGFDLLLNTLKSIPQNEQFELKAVQTLIRKCIQEQFPTSYRNNSWLANGLAQYLFIRYVETYFSDLRLIGNLSTLPFLSSYEFAKTSFSYKNVLQAGFAYRRNLTQPLQTPSQDLTKYNRLITQRARTAMGLRIIEKTQGKSAIDELIFSYFTSRNITKSRSFERLLQHVFGDDTNWFYDGYVKETGLTDYKLKIIEQTKNNVEIELINKTAAKNPVKLDYYLDHQIISARWLTGGKKSQILSIDKHKVDRIVINPDQDVLEVNVNNNNLDFSPNFSKRQARFRLFEDIPTSHAPSVYYAPNFSFNAYDGVLMGLILHNGLIMKQPTSFVVSPQYASKEKSVSGSFSISHRAYFQQKKLAALNYGLGFQSYHFDTNQRYYRISPSFSAVFRPEGLASNKRSILSAQFVSLHQQNILSKSTIAYNTAVVGYSIIKSSSSASRTFGVSAQIGDSFSKLSASFKKRKYYSQARQYSYRFFFGALTNKTNTNNFNFGVSRVNDYSFNYNLLGRSETTGIFSQQYVKGDAGFKSFIPVVQANQWVLASNLSTTIWRGLEMYGDLGFVKNKEKDASFIYDAGIGLNLVQDYLQLYFPVYSNLGWEVNDNKYSTKIRFTLSLKGNDIISLFTRSWF